MTEAGKHEFKERVGSLRTLTESEKVALICGQQYQLHQIQDRVQQLRCAHESGQCVLCADKDKTITEQNEGTTSYLPVFKLSLNAIDS